MSQGKSNNEITRDLIRGDKKAFDDIYLLYHDRLFNFAREYLEDKHDTDDIIQNVFTKLWVNRDLLDKESNIGAWLFTVTRNESLSFLEHRRIVMAHRENANSLLLNANLFALKNIKLPDDNLFNIIDILEKSLFEMPDRSRKVFMMSRAQNLSYKEIAKELSLSVKTVESHMHKALKMLRISLRDYLPLIIFFLFN